MLDERALQERFSTGHAKLIHGRDRMVTTHTNTQKHTEVHIMKRSTMISSLLLGASLAVGGFMLAPSFADDKRTATTDERQWLPIQNVIDKLEAAGYRDIEKIEREHGRYKVRATNRNGERSKLYVSPQTGEITDRGSHDKRNKTSADRPKRGNALATFIDCNERRCRDDQPQKATPAAPTQTPAPAPVNK